MKLRFVAGWILLILGSIFALPFVLTAIVLLIVGCALLLPGVFLIPETEVKFGDQILLSKKGKAGQVVTTTTTTVKRFVRRL